jgi:hypothetical protein
MRISNDTRTYVDFRTGDVGCFLEPNLAKKSWNGVGTGRGRYGPGLAAGFGLVAWAFFPT